MRVKFRLRVGSCAFHVGPSGSGKNTLRYALAALNCPTAVTILEAGREIEAMSDAARDDHRRNRMGFRPPVVAEAARGRDTPGDVGTHVMTAQQQTPEKPRAVRLQSSSGTSSSRRRRVDAASRGRGARTTAELTATRRAPASRTSSRFDPSIPPMANQGEVVDSAAWRT